jgi:hypothetical protein
MKIIKKREPDQDDDANDLLGILLAANRKELRGTRKDLSLSMRSIVDECKLFFFAGHETTATLLTWTAMLLSIYPEWQEKARNEVLLHVSADESHLNSYESLHSLKIVSFPDTSVIIIIILKLHFEQPQNCDRRFSCFFCVLLKSFLLDTLKIVSLEIFWWLFLLFSLQGFILNCLEIVVFQTNYLFFLLFYLQSFVLSNLDNLVVFSSIFFQSFILSSLEMSSFPDNSVVFFTKLHSNWHGQFLLFSRESSPL